MPTIPKQFPITEGLLARWLSDCEKSRKSFEPVNPVEPTGARAVPVRFMFGIDRKNAIVPILHRSESLQRSAGVSERQESFRAGKPDDHRSRH